MSTRNKNRMILCIIGLLSFMPGCSDDTTVFLDQGPGTDGISIEGGGACVLNITSINGKAVAQVTKLDATHDQDTTAPGLQIDVAVSVAKLASGGTINLSVTGLPNTLTATPVSGVATFKGVTIGPTITQVVLFASASDTSCQTSQIVRTAVPAPECSFTDPVDGATLGSSIDPSSYLVKVGTVNATAGKVELLIDGTSQGSKNVDAKGMAEFPGMKLPDGAKRELVAKVSASTGDRQCKATVVVNTKAPPCTLSFSPKPLALSATKAGFGKAQDAKTSTSGLETDVTITTGSTKTEVTLLIDKTPQPKVTATSGTASFNAVALKDGARKVGATCVEVATGNQGTSNPAELEALVDTLSPLDVSASGLSCTAADPRKNEIKVTWTAVDDKSPGGSVSGSGVATYDVRYRTDAPCTDANWDTTGVTKVLPALTAFPPGATQTEPLQKLPLGKTYHVCLKAVDLVLNASQKVASCSPLKVDFRVQERQGKATNATVKGWGSTIAAGDFTCDGRTDIAVGVPQVNNNLGAVYIFSGKPNGLLNSADMIINGTQAGGKFGAELATLGNFDGDSKKCNDLAVTSSDGGTMKEGRVYVYLGGGSFHNRDDVSVGKGAEMIYRLASPSATEHLGQGISGAADFDNDGATDLAVSYSNTATTSDEARIVIIYGDKTLTLMASGQSPTIQNLSSAGAVAITGGKASEGFGMAMASGNVDKDAYGDVIVGAKSTQVSSVVRGAVYVIKGGARASTLPENIPLGTSGRVVTIKGGTANSALGAKVAFVGDMDKDGNAEFAVSDTGYATKTGIVYLFNLGGSTPPSGPGDAVATVTNDVTGATGDEFGIDLADAGSFAAKDGADINSDGYADLVVGAKEGGTSGAGAVYYVVGAKSLVGMTSSKAMRIFTATGGVSFGQRVVLAKDVEGNGYVDIVVGDPLYDSGMGRLFLYY